MYIKDFIKGSWSFFVEWDVVRQPQNANASADSSLKL